MHTKSLDPAWPTVLSLAGHPTATPDDPVSTEPFSLADIAEVVAESAAAQGDVAGLLWRGIFVLRDGRAAAVFGHTVDGWRSGSATAYVGSSVSTLWRRHGRGNARFALYGQYQCWHATWCARKLIAFLECQACWRERVKEGGRLLGFVQAVRLLRGGGAVRCASDQFEMADPDGWNWQRAEPAA